MVINNFYKIIEVISELCLLIFHNDLLEKNILECVISFDCLAFQQQKEKLVVSVKSEML